MGGSGTTTRADRCMLASRHSLAVDLKACLEHPDGTLLDASEVAPLRQLAEARRCCGPASRCQLLTLHFVSQLLPAFYQDTLLLHGLCSMACCVTVQPMGCSYGASICLPACT